MKHHIIVKWNSSVEDKDEILKEVSELYSSAKELPGISGAEIIPNCIPRENRYDCMIVLDMEKDALPVWDASEVHHIWKEQYGGRIEKKAIFDCE